MDKGILLNLKFEIRIRAKHPEGINSKQIRISNVLNLLNTF